MSPANIDDSSGNTSSGAARALTRKEIRAREKSLHTDGSSVVPEQAYETGDVFPAAAEVPEPVIAPTARPAAETHVEPVIQPGPVIQPWTEPAAQAAPAAPASSPIPAAPDTPPSIQEVEPAYAVGSPYDDVAAEELHTAVHPVPVQAAVHHETDAHETEAYGHYYEPDGTHHADGQHHDAYHSADYFEDQHHDEHHDGHHQGGVLGGATAVSVVAGPSKKVRRRRRFLALFLTLAVFVVAVAVGAQFLKPLLGTDKLSDYPGPGTGEVQLTVEPGQGPRAVATNLESQKVVANADTFLQAFTASGATLAPGDYIFRTEMKNSDAVNVLVGKDKGKVIYFALSAGLRIGESLQAISEGSGVPLQDLQALSNQPAQFGLPATAKNLEGYLAPGEHRFPLGTPAKDILQALVKITVDELVAQGITDPAKQYEAVIVASIVQAEGGQAEYGDVAGAIYNRLKPNDQTGGFLQVDSAVTYGLGTKSYNFTDAERQDKGNPYNTYANPGLPPGPIGSPGKTAIDAAARPKSNDYLYWVTINLDTKETKFSRTLAEHNSYVEQYNAWCMANVGRCA
ncbi:endolytic transglycosylase MltG [Arthrobacter sp. D1-29]